MEVWNGGSPNYFKLSELNNKCGRLEITEDLDCTVTIFHCEDGNAYIINIQYRED